MKQGNLLSDLVSIPPRETAGSRSANRFDFQKAWGLCRLLELHEAGSNYLMVFDYHEDIVVLDSPTSPSSVCFYQVKSRSASQGNWTRKRLLKRDQGKDGPLLSPLGKLHGNLLNFPNQTTLLCLVSNAVFDLRLKDAASDSKAIARIRLDELDDAELALIRKQLREEHGLKANPKGEDITYFEVTNLQLTDCSTHALGKLTEYLQTAHPDVAASPTTVYRTLFGEIGRRTNEEQLPHSVEELLALKALSRSDFHGMLASIAASPRPDEIISTIRDRLNQEQVAFADAHRLCLDCKRYFVDRTDKTNTLLTTAASHISTAVVRLQDEGLPPRLSDALEAVLALSAVSLADAKRLYSDTYLKAMIAVRLYDLREFQETCPQSKD